MDDLIIASLQGLTTDEEEESLHVWRRANLQNERHYRDMTRAWHLSALLEPAAARTLPSRSMAALPAPRRRLVVAASRVAPFLTAAASLLVGLGLGTLAVGRGVAPELGSTELVTGANESATTRLSDGTVVRLGADSRLRISTQGDAREAWLDGHAFFAVARENGRRFVVRTRAGDAVVLGTRFDVKVGDDGMQVFVLEGKVAHHAGGREVEVNAMELSRAGHSGGPDVVAVTDPAPLLDWLGEFLVFRSTPMREVAREIERHFRVQVRLADERVAQRTVTAWFTNESLDEVLLIVCRAADAHCMVRDNVVTIEP